MTLWNDVSKIIMYLFIMRLILINKYLIELLFQCIHTFYLYIHWTKQLRKIPLILQIIKNKKLSSKTIEYLKEIWNHCDTCMRYWRRLRRYFQTHIHSYKLVYFKNSPSLLLTLSPLLFLQPNREKNSFFFTFRYKITSFAVAQTVKLSALSRTLLISLLLFFSLSKIRRHKMKIVFCFMVTFYFLTTSNVRSGKFIGKLKSKNFL